VHRQVGTLRKVLSQQAIGVLVRSALPRALRIAKIDVDFGRQRKATMIRKFLALVPGQGLYSSLGSFFACLMSAEGAQPTLVSRRPADLWVHVLNLGDEKGE
jgi:hypothetical protein